ncbi:hypothetical protein HPB48_000203 [Haemaphysalis longicornis]|uniref:Uncharacterized protein n=1 Tax=Haemaphysalis longicornis TaxID=44386 RepID=A0A9J6GI32_HAELO|nr:hypothetical protein HPB48_000203 [Haemaphysalis longicornis]
MGAVDGKDLWTVLVDDRPSPRTEFLYNINYQWKMAALRIGNHKLVLGASPLDRYDGWYVHLVVQLVLLLGQYCVSPLMNQTK